MRNVDIKKKYNIMTSCDDNLAPYVTVGLTAMAYNLKDADINFYLLHSQISEKNIELLKCLCRNLENGKIAEYFYLWHEYAIITDNILKEIDI